MLIRILRFIIEVLWPVYYTTKKVNVCDEEKFWPLLKYWGLRIFVWLTEFVLSFLMHEYIFNVLVLVSSLALVVNNFRLSSFIFDNLVMSVVQGRFDDIKTVFESMEGTVHGV